MKRAIVVIAAFVMVVASSYFAGIAMAHRMTAAHKTMHVSIVTDPSAIGAYKPAAITVHRGDRIVFKNVSNAPHTVSAKNNSFSSGNMNIGKSWTYTAKKTGTFPYFCQYHGGMHGKIVVKA